MLKKWLLKNALDPKRLWNRWTISQFHRLYYYAGTSWQGNTFLGHKIQQMPFDLWTYQHIVYTMRPSFILQTGIFHGGSLLYFAKLLDLAEANPSVPVIGVDIHLTPEALRLNNPRIHLIEGSSTDPNIVQRVAGMVSGSGMVILDSDHTCEHVLQELNLYSNLVGVGQYLVVEDTNINGHPVEPSFGPGPMEAVQSFLAQNTRFAPDDDVWKRHLFSHHQNGWLKRNS